MLIDLVALLSLGLFAGAAVYVTLVEHPARRQWGRLHAARTLLGGAALLLLGLHLVGAR